MEHTFTLKFKLASADANPDALLGRLAESGCTDALVGLGVPGSMSLDFAREGETEDLAILSALQDTRRALPSATLVW